MQAFRPFHQRPDLRADESCPVEQVARIGWHRPGELPAQPGRRLPQLAGQTFEGGRVRPVQRIPQPRLQAAPNPGSGHPRSKSPQKAGDQGSSGHSGGCASCATLRTVIKCTAPQPRATAPARPGHTNSRSFQIGADRAAEEVYPQMVRACSNNSELAERIARFAPS